MNGRHRRATLAALTLTLAAAGVRAQDAPPAHVLRPARIRVALNGAASLGKPSLRDERRYTEYAETAVVTTTEDVKAGFLTDVSVDVRLYRRLGLLAGYSFGTRSAKGGFVAQSPHPLYLAQPRALKGDFSGYDYKEGALHVDLAYTGNGRGRLDWTLFAGPSFFQVKPEVLDRLTLLDRYPYDEPNAATPSKRLSVSATGWNVGGRLDLRLARFMGIGAQLRYAGAKARVRATADATETTVDAGGLQLGAGARLYF